MILNALFCKQADTYVVTGSREVQANWFVIVLLPFVRQDYLEVRVFSCLRHQARHVQFHRRQEFPVDDAAVGSLLLAYDFHRVVLRHQLRASVPIRHHFAELEESRMGVYYFINCKTN